MDTAQVLYEGNREARLWMWTYLCRERCPDRIDDRSRSGVLTTMSNHTYRVSVDPTKATGGKRANFVLYTFICKGSRCRLAEEDNAPLSSLSELQAIIIDLMGQLACRSQNKCTDTFPCVYRRA